MRKMLRRERTEAPESAPGQAPEQADRVEAADVEATLAEIDCCLEEVATDDEQAAKDAFSELYARRRENRISEQEMKDEGDLLRVRFAHTDHVQSYGCCSCSCPWND